MAAKRKKPGTIDTRTGRDAQGRYRNARGRFVEQAAAAESWALAREVFAARRNVRPIDVTPKNKKARKLRVAVEVREGIERREEWVEILRDRGFLADEETMGEQKDADETRLSLGLLPKPHAQKKVRDVLTRVWVYEGLDATVEDGVVERILFHVRDVDGLPGTLACIVIFTDNPKLPTPSNRKFMNLYQAHAWLMGWEREPSAKAVIDAAQMGERLFILLELLNNVEDVRALKVPKLSKKPKRKPKPKKQPKKSKPQTERKRGNGKRKKPVRRVQRKGRGGVRKPSVRNVPKPRRKVGKNKAQPPLRLRNTGRRKKTPNRSVVRKTRKR